MQAFLVGVGALLRLSDVCLFKSYTVQRRIKILLAGSLVSLSAVVVDMLWVAISEGEEDEQALTLNLLLVPVLLKGSFVLWDRHALKVLHTNFGSKAQEKSDSISGLKFKIALVLNMLNYARYNNQVTKLMVQGLVSSEYFYGRREGGRDSVSATWCEVPSGKQ